MSEATTPIGGRGGVADSFNFFQTAYVVADMESAMAQFGELYGLSRFQLNREVVIQTGDGEAVCHFALAQVGEAQLELIQPAGGRDAIYRDALGGAPARLHHLGCLIRAPAVWERLRAKLRGEGARIPVEGDFGGLMHYLYVDRRAVLGHYLEYMLQTEAGRDLFAGVPRHPGLPLASQF